MDCGMGGVVSKVRMKSFERPAILLPSPFPDVGAQAAVFTTPSELSMKRSVLFLRSF
jgi:hypothetical protein